MIISRSMDKRELARLMGGSSTEADAATFRDILVESGHCGVDTSYITSTERWHTLLDKMDDTA